MSFHSVRDIGLLPYLEITPQSIGFLTPNGGSARLADALTHETLAFFLWQRETFFDLNDIAPGDEMLKVTALLFFAGGHAAPYRQPPQGNPTLQAPARSWRQCALNPLKTTRAEPRLTIQRTFRFTHTLVLASETWKSWLPSLVSPR